MTDIAPIGRSQPTSLGAVSRNGRAATTPEIPPRGPDRVEVSSVARYLARLQEMPQVRTELIERVREEIAAGHYESPEKIAAAVDNMIEDLA